MWAEYTKVQTPFVISNQIKIKRKKILKNSAVKNGEN